MLDQVIEKDYIKPSQINDSFVSLFNKPGPYYSSYPVLGEWQNIKENIDYMDTKTTRMGHLLDSEDLVVDEDRNE